MTLIAWILLITLLLVVLFAVGEVLLLRSDIERQENTIIELTVERDMQESERERLIGVLQESRRNLTNVALSLHDPANPPPLIQDGRRVSERIHAESKRLYDEMRMVNG